MNCLLPAWICIACVLLQAAPSWKRIGLEGTEVTALCRSQAVDIPNYDGLFIGTKNHGVYQLRQDQISNFGSGGGPQWTGLVSMDTCVIHSMISIERNFPSVLGPLIYAGTNKGLYAYAIRSGLPSGWIKINDFPQTDVWDLLLADSILYAGADYRIYRSQGPVQTSPAWDTLDMTQLFPAGQLPPRFICLLSPADSSNVILAGSVTGGVLSSWAGWTGVVRGTDGGDNWEKWNQGWVSEAPSVTALASYGGAFLAGTDSGLYIRGESDTSWHPWWLPTGMENRAINDLYCVEYAGQYPYSVYAATDSGVYYHMLVWSSLPSFRRMDNGIPPVPVNALCAAGGTDSLFAGTIDGLYLLAEHDSVGIETPVPDNQLDFTVFPNPFNPSTSISCNLGQGRSGAIRIYDIRGKMVFERAVQGLGTITWDASGQGSGIYVLKALSAGKTYSRKLILQQ